MKARIAGISAFSCLLFSILVWEASASSQPVSPAADSLSYIPGDSISFVHLEGDALWNSSLFAELQKRVPAEKWKKFETDFFQASEKMIGMPRKNVRSTTLIIDGWDVPQVPAFAMLLTSTLPIERARFIKSIKSFFEAQLSRFDEGHINSPSVKHDGIELTPIGSLPGKKLYAGLAQANIACFGDLETLQKIIKQKKSGAAEGPLAVSIKAARGHDIAVGAHLPESLQNQLMAAMQMSMGLPQMQDRPDFARMLLGFKIIETLLDIKQLHLLLDIQKHLALNITVQANSEKSAVRIQRMLDLMALFGDYGFQYLDGEASQTPTQNHRDVKKVLPLLAEASANSKIVLSGTTVVFNLKSDNAGQELTSAAAAVLVRMVMTQDRMQRQSNLRQLAIAMHNYHGDYNKLPSVAYYGANRTVPKPGSGEKPLLSWRVYLLPYLEADNLFKQFHLDEPWDSEHNKKLIPAMPKCFACPGAPDPGVGKTYLQVFAAPEKPAKPDKQKYVPVFQFGKLGLTLGQLTVQDGTSNTLMIAEANKAVTWTKPEDILIEDDDMPLPTLGAVPDEDSFLAVYGDGSVRSILKKLPDSKEHERLLRQLIGRRDDMHENVAPIVK